MSHIPTVSQRRALRIGALPALAAAAGLLCSTMAFVQPAAAAPAAAASSSKATPKAKAPVHTSKGKAKVVKPVVPPVVDVVLLPAPQEQLDAAERVYYGVYDCEFKQVIEIQADPKNVGYVEVRHAKSVYVMKPVLSSTGAIRLEDVRGVTLMVQIAQKSMLMDVKVGHRLVDECVSPRQRELMEAARVKVIEDEKKAKAEAASAAASAAESAAAKAADDTRPASTAASAPVKS